MMIMEVCGCVCFKIIFTIKVLFELLVKNVEEGVMLKVLNCPFSTFSH